MSNVSVNHCNANLTASFVDLATYDELESTCMVVNLPLTLYAKHVNLRGSLNTTLCLPNAMAPRVWC